MSAFMLSLGLGCSDPPGEQLRPNVLLVVLDDFGFNDLAANAGSNSPTPALDALAAEGVRFTRHYAESTCTPSRVALLTGMHAARAGAHPTIRGLDRGLQMLPETMRDAGYATHLVGKWHAGESHDEARPEHHGFDHWLGFISQILLAGPLPTDDSPHGWPTYRDPWLDDETGRFHPHEGHLTDLLTDRALSIIDSEPDPWFVYLAYFAPHTPIEPAERFATRYPDDPAGRYQALKEQLDHNIGRIFDRLEERDELDETLIVVVSDNGGTARDWPSNFPYSGWKNTYLEGGVRTPLIIRWPRRWPIPFVHDEPVAIFDIYPTIVAALGLDPVADLDGRDVFGPQPERELMWFQHQPISDKLSILSADGLWRLSSWLGVLRTLDLSEEATDPSQPNHVLEQADLADVLEARARDWIREVTRVDRMNAIDAPPFRYFEGDEFRRTPISGNHTMGFTLARISGNDTSPLPLVRQAGYIRVGVDQDQDSDELVIEVDSQHQSVMLPDAECVTLMVQTHMIKKNKLLIAPDSLSVQNVYVDGELVATHSYRNRELSEAPPSSPLEIRVTGDGRWRVAGDAPYLSTRSLRADEIRASVHPELAKACAPPHG